jgi:hypothetical protein
MTITRTHYSTDAEHAAAEAERRDAYLAGLRALERLIGARTDVPLPNSGTDYCALGEDDDIIREVDHVALALGTRAAWSPAGHYIAALDLGGGVWYRAIAVPRAAKARDAAAHVTYIPCGSVAEVDGLASQWGVTAHWNPEELQYEALRRGHGKPAEVAWWCPVEDATEAAVQPVTATGSAA